MKKIINKKQQGFTLLETLVAIFILTLSMTGPVYIASVAFHNTIDSRDNISAQYIAEEVIEVIRNRRDKNTLSDSDMTKWLDNITGSANCLNQVDAQDNKCIMIRDESVTDGYEFEKCNGDCSNISFDPEGAGAVYGDVDGPGQSKFVREFYYETDTVNNPGEIKLTVNIRWEDKGRPKVYTLVERLYAVNYNQYFNVQ